eukprot:scaffold153292_cov17-Prasinocladus_malaysianus.AAC.1
MEANEEHDVKQTDVTTCALPGGASGDPGGQEGDGEAGDVLDGRAGHRRPRTHREDHEASALHSACQVCHLTSPLLAGLSSLTMDGRRVVQCQMPGLSCGSPSCHVV